MHRPYGDQGIFVQRAVLEQVGGFKDWPLLEDIDLVERLSRDISPPAIVPCAVQTSGRRWSRLGFWRTTALNQWILLQWRMGASVERLAAVYYGSRSQQ
jgi:hypothetical protein